MKNITNLIGLAYKGKAALAVVPVYVWTTAWQGSSGDFFVHCKASQPQDCELNLPGGQYAYMYVKISHGGSFYYHLQFNAKKESINGFIKEDDFMTGLHVNQDEDDAPFPYVVIIPTSAILESFHHAYKGTMTVMVDMSPMASLDFDLDNVKNPYV